MRKSPPLLATLAIPILLASLSTGVHANFAEVHKLVANDGSQGDDFGIAIDINQDWMVAGAMNHNDNGAAYVFDTTSANQVFKLTGSNTVAGDGFGRSVALGGDDLVIGAKGSAYVFDLTTGLELHQLTSSDGLASFGIAAAIAQGRAAVADSSGAAYLFDIATGHELRKFTPSDAGQVDLYTQSVAMSGDRVLLGAMGEFTPGIYSGAAYMFDANTGGQLFKFTGSGATSNNQFGYSVALSDDHAAIGAWGEGNSTGAAYVFDILTGTERHRIEASDGAAGDLFGLSVAVDGDHVLIGAAGTADMGILSGAGYLFTASTGEEITKLNAHDGSANDILGFTSAIDGDHVLLGAWNDDLGTGSAYHFQDIPEPEPEAPTNANDGDPNAVPLPTSVLLMAAGLALLGKRRSAARLDQASPVRISSRSTLVA